MKKTLAITLLLIFNATISGAKAQDLPFAKAEISVTAEVKKSFLPGGRLILYLTKQREKEPRFKSDITIGVTPVNWDLSMPYLLIAQTKLKLVNGLEKNLPLTSEKFYCQVDYKQNPDDGQENVPGNFYSNVDSVVLTPNAKLRLTLNKVIPPNEIVEHQFVKSLVIKSKFLSAFSGRPRFLRASILLPSGYFKNPGKAYPICYRAPGLNGRYTAVNGHINNKEFTDWWLTDSAPQVIYVYLDSQGPYGDTYQVDSENNGPCGKALTEELIPEIEKLVHYNPESKMRFLTGYSTGGQFGAYNAVFGPKGAEGLPSLMFDPVTGKIDHAIAAQWEKYDLKKVLEKNWSTLGPKLQGKIWIWTGDADGLYSNVATRFLKMYMDSTKNPKSDAKISFTPLAGHCQEWSDKVLLQMVAAKAAAK